MDLIKNSVVLLTGADGGIGQGFIDVLLQKNARKIYISGINEEKLKELSLINPAKLIPIKIDVTNFDQIESIASQLSDVTTLINNAGVELKSTFVGDNAYKKAEFEMRVNYFGMLCLCNVFIPHLKKNENSSIINMLSLGALVSIRKIETYCASKAASHLLTQSLREHLRGDLIKVIGIYPGYIDTDMISDFDVAKFSVENLMAKIFDEIELGFENIFPDPMSKKYIADRFSSFQELI